MWYIYINMCIINIIPKKCKIPFLFNMRYIKNMMRFSNISDQTVTILTSPLAWGLGPSAGPGLGKVGDGGGSKCYHRSVIEVYRKTINERNQKKTKAAWLITYQFHVLPKTYNDPKVDTHLLVLVFRPTNKQMCSHKRGL